MATEAGEIAAKLEGLEPGLMTMPETLALAEKALLEMLCNEATADSSKLKAIEMVFLKHQVGKPEDAKPMATKECVHWINTYTKWLRSISLVQ